MSFRNPNRHPSDSPGHEDASEPGSEAQPSGRRRRDSEQAFLAGSVRVGNLHCVAQEIRATVDGELAGFDVVARGPVIGRVATSRALLAAIEHEAELIETNRLLMAEAVDHLAGAPNGWTGQDAGFVAITLDPRFVSDDSFLTAVKDATRNAGLDPNQLLLSVEADLALVSLWPNLQRLKSHGVQVALEGFRLGPPANDLVSRFSLDVLRVDMANLAVDDDSDPRSELVSIVRLAEDLRCRVMAEHFSSRDQVELAVEAGCDLVVLPAADGVS